MGNLYKPSHQFIIWPSGQERLDTNTYQERLNNWKDQRTDAAENLTADQFSLWLHENPKPLLTEGEHRELLDARLQAAEDRNNKRAQTFCPLSHDFCITACECYIPATVRGSVYEADDETGEPTIPYISGGYCTAYILKGGGE